MILLGVVAFIFFGIILAKGDDQIAATGEGLDGILYLAYVVFALTIAFVLFFVVKGIFAGNIKNTLISVGIFVAIVLLSYILADGGTISTGSGAVLEGSGAKWISTGLWTFYILAVVAIIATVLSSFKKTSN